MNGTTTIAVAKEIENNQKLQGKSSKDTTGIILHLLLENESL